MLGLHERDSARQPAAAALSLWASTTATVEASSLDSTYHRRLNQIMKEITQIATTRSIRGKNHHCCNSHDTNLNTAASATRTIRIFQYSGGMSLTPVPLSFYVSYFCVCHIRSESDVETGRTTLIGQSKFTACGVVPRLRRESGWRHWIQCAVQTTPPCL